MTAPLYRSESSTNSMNYAPLSGQAILAEMNNPESPLYKDLYNARMDALQKKKARETMVGEMIEAQQLNEKIEDLEDEMALAREAARVQSCDDFEKYYAEQHKAMMKEIELLGSFNQDPYFAALTSLEQNVQQLVLAQNELNALYAQREEAVRNYEYYNNNEAFVDIFADQVQAGGTFELSNGRTISLDTKHLSVEKKQEIQAEQAKIIKELKEYKRLPKEASVKKVNSQLIMNGYFVSEEKQKLQMTFMDLMADMKRMRLLRAQAEETNAGGITVTQQAALLGIMDGRAMQVFVSRKTTATLQLGSVTLLCETQENVVVSAEKNVFNDFLGLSGKNKNINNDYVNEFLASNQPNVVLKEALRNSGLRAGR